MKDYTTFCKTNAVITKFKIMNNKTAIQLLKEKILEIQSTYKKGSEGHNCFGIAANLCDEYYKNEMLSDNVKTQKLTPLHQNECEVCALLIDPRLNICSDCGLFGL